MAYETLEERQIEYSRDGGKTWQDHSVKDTIEQACTAIRELSRLHQDCRFRRKFIRNAYESHRLGRKIG